MAISPILTHACQAPLPPDASILIFSEAKDWLLAHQINAPTYLYEEPIKSICDLALFIGPSPTITSSAVLQNIVAARDRWAKQVLIILLDPHERLKTDQLFFGLGFTRRPMCNFPEEEISVYGFSISNYKKTPDWLNAKYWANPERWGIRQ